MTFRPEQIAYIAARAAVAVCAEALKVARTAIAFPVDYDTNDAAADAYEEALMAAEKSTGYTAAKGALYAAECAMVTAEIDRIRAVFPAQSADLQVLTTERARAMPHVWSRIVDMCSRVE